MKHHMFPMVLYYNLPALHEEIKHDCPDAAASFFAALRETIAAIRKAQFDRDYIVPRYREFAEKLSLKTGGTR